MPWTMEFRFSRQNLFSGKAIDAGESIRKARFRSSAEMPGLASIADDIPISGPISPSSVARASRCPVQYRDAQHPEGLKNLCLPLPVVFAGSADLSPYHRQHHQRLWNRFPAGERFCSGLGRQSRVSVPEPPCLPSHRFVGTKSKGKLTRAAKIGFLRHCKTTRLPSAFSDRTRRLPRPAANRTCQGRLPRIAQLGRDIIERSPFAFKVPQCHLTPDFLQQI